VLPRKVCGDDGTMGWDVPPYFLSGPNSNNTSFFSASFAFVTKSFDI
jgi:hypothetical protein